MNKAMLLCFVSITTAVGGMMAGCGGDETTTDDGAACFDYAGFDGTTPATTFRADVLPLFVRSCGLSTSCHGDPSSPNDAATMGRRQFLGPPATMASEVTDMQIDAIFAANVNKDSVKGAGMKVIAPGSPDQSFLMHKMDGLCGAELKCEGVGAGTGCGETMPQKASILPQAERDVVRRWIAQGAKND